MVFPVTVTDVSIYHHEDFAERKRASVANVGCKGSLRVLTKICMMVGIEFKNEVGGYVNLV